MKKSVLSRFSFILSLAFLILSGMRTSAQCPISFTNVSLDGGGNTTTVSPGATVNLTLDYDINNLICSSCIVQHVIGLDNTPLDCVYDGVAATCPSTTTGSYSLAITAPATPGRYAINVSDQTAQFTCADAQNLFAAATKTQIGTITVCGGEYFDNVTLNGIGNDITVAPGATVSVALDYEFSNEICPSCIVQHVLGMDNTPLDCIYDGIAATCPSTESGAYLYSFTAPLTPGTYAINVSEQMAQFTCSDAQNQFSTANKTQIATLTVCLPKSFDNVLLNGTSNAITVSPGDAVSVSLDYTFSNEICSSCIVQHVLGLDTTAMDCIYNGVAASCPNSETGSYSYSFTAPTTPGVYAINVGEQTAQFTCLDAENLFAAGSKTQIATLTVCGAESFNNVSLNGISNDITVAPGDAVTVSLDYAFSNEICPSCIVQHVIGIDNTPLDCVYNGIAATCPGQETGSYSYSFTAPTTAGVYAINISEQMAQFSCLDAENLFSTAGKSQIATLTVCDGVSFTNVDMNGQGSNASVAVNSTVNLSLDYNVNNQICSSCIVQHVVGLDNTPMDCVYNGVAPNCPTSDAGTYTYTFTAPATAGTYALNISDQKAQFTCVDAENLFAAEPKSQIGTLVVTSGVGIQDVATEASFTVSPNPLNEKCTISMKVIKEGDAQLKVINTSGQIVYAESLYQPAGDFSKVLDLKNLAAGIYTLQYSTQHQTMKKLLVIK